MKRILKKILIIILIVLLLNNFLISSVYADDTPVNTLGDVIGGLFSGVVGILTFIYRAPAVLIGWLINKFMSGLAYSEGAIDNSVDTSFISVFDILFTRPKILDIDFFDIKSGDTSLVNQFRTNVAAWFYIMRNISTGILLVILIYIGIRMAITTIASDRAMYKKMLVDWTVSLVLVFVLNYIIIFTIQINKALINALAKVQTSNSELAAAISTFGWQGINIFGGIPSIVAAIIYLMLIWQTMALFFSYFNRMLKIAFLIIIAPLISLTYSIDKIGDGKAQALDAWLKEFVFTVLMQPFHCVIYLSLISTSINILLKGVDFTTDISHTLGAGILAITCIMFTKEAEKIVRHIFGFQDDNKGTSLVAGAALASLAINKTQNLGKGSVAAFKSGKNFIKNGKDSLRLTNIKAELKAAKRYIAGDKDKDTGEKTQKDYGALRSEERAKAYNKLVEKKKEKLDKLTGDENTSKFLLSDAKRFEQEKEFIKNESNREMSDEEVEAVAKFNLAKKAISETSKVRKVANAPKKLFTATKNTARNLADKIPFSETRKFLAGEARKSFGLVTGSASLMYSGKVSTAVTTAVISNKVADDIAKNIGSSYTDRIGKLMNGDPKEEKEGGGHSESGEPEKVLHKVNNNQQDYDIPDDNGKALPTHLADIIKELNDAFKDMGWDKVEESNVRQTILQNTKQPEKGIDDLLGFKRKDVNDSVKNAKETGDPDQIAKAERARKAYNDLKDYSIEYSISKEMSNAREVNISSGELINNYLRKNNSLSTRQKNRMENTAIYKELTGEDNILDRRKEITEKMDADRLEELYEFINKQIGNRANFDNKNNKLIEAVKERYEKATQEYERKKALLIGQAVADLDDENKKAAESLRDKILGDIKNLLEKDFSSEEKEELENLKIQLKNV